MIGASTRRPNSRRPWRRLLAVPALAAGLLILLPAPAASAHAFLTASTPADGATLDSAPTQIQLSFSESVALDAMQIDIVDSHGVHFEPTDLRLAGGAGDSAGTEEPVEVVADLPPLARDAYRLSWRTLSSDDLHTTSGVLVFGIGQQVTAAGSVEPIPGLDEALLRAAVFVSLALCLGGLLAGRLLARSGGGVLGMHGAQQCRRFAAWGAAAGMLAGLGLLADQVVVGGLSVDGVLLSSYGAHFALRELGFGLLLIAALLNVRLPGRAVLTVVGAIGVGIGTALMGHAGAGLVASITRIVADASHLLAAATWSGTLLLAVFVALPLARRTGGAAIAGMLRAFGIPAAGCLGIMVVSGVYLTSGVVGSVDALLRTFYGRTLILKLLVVGVIGVLGLLNHRRLRSRTDRRIPHRTIIIEASAALVVLLLAGILTSSQPAMEPTFVQAGGDASVPVRDQSVGDLEETISIRPNTPGANVIVVSVADTRRPAPAPIGTVLIALIDPDFNPGQPIAATKMGDGQWSVTTNIGWTSRFEVMVTVERAGLPDVTASYPWTLGAAVGSAKTVLVSTAPLAGALKATSGFLLIMLLLVAGFMAIRGVRRSRLQRNLAGSETPAIGSADGGPQGSDRDRDLADAKTNSKT